MAESGTEYIKKGPVNSPVSDYNGVETTNYRISQPESCGPDIPCLDYTVTPKFKFYKVNLEFYERPFTIEGSPRETTAYLPQGISIFRGGNTQNLEIDTINTPNYSLISKKRVNDADVQFFSEELKAYKCSAGIYEIEYSSGADAGSLVNSVNLRYKLINKNKKVLIIYYPLQYSTSYRTKISEEVFKHIQFKLDADFNNFVSQVQRMRKYDNIYVRVARDKFVDSGAMNIKDFLLLERVVYDSPDYQWSNESLEQDYENYVRDTTSVVHIIYLDSYSTGTMVLNKFRTLNNARIYFINFMEMGRIDSASTERALQNLKYEEIKISNLEENYQNIFNMNNIRNFFGF